MGQIDERCKHHNNLQSALITTATHRGGDTGFLWGVGTDEAHTHTRALSLKSNTWGVIHSLLCMCEKSLDDTAGVPSQTWKQYINACF